MRHQRNLSDTLAVFGILLSVECFQPPSFIVIFFCTKFVVCLVRMEYLCAPSEITIKRREERFEVAHRYYQLLFKMLQTECKYATLPHSAPLSPPVVHYTIHAVQLFIIWPGPLLCNANGSRRLSRQLFEHCIQFVTKLNKKRHE